MLINRIRKDDPVWVKKDVQFVKMNKFKERFFINGLAIIELDQLVGKDCRDSWRSITQRSGVR